jgi:hypothetical protein
MNLLISIGAGIASIVWFEIYKAAKIFRNRKNSKIIE